MEVSVVVPAYNEETLLGACLSSVRAAFAALGETGYEIVVSDNNSTDRTAAVAAAAGARVVFEPLRLIGMARNAGAARACGEWLLFVDADSELSPDTLAEALALMRSGRCVGGGALIGFDAPAPPAWGRVLTAFWNLLSRSLRLAAGSFLFCRREAFLAAGGFSPQFYAGEELLLSRSLRRWGLAKGLSFEIITTSPHVSSGRKFRLYGTVELLGMALGFALRPLRAVKDPGRLGIFYDGRR